LIGKAFRGRRNRVIIATKVGTRYSPAARAALRMRPLLRPVSRWLQPSKNYLHQARSTYKHSDFSPSYLRRALEMSLKRLNTDYVDLLQLHKPSASVLDEGSFCETVEQFKREGKIRFYGIACDHGPSMIDDAMRCLKLPGLSSVQVTVNLVQRQAIESFLPQACAQGLAVLVRNPRDQGYLTAAGSDIMAETYDKTSLEVQIRMEQAQRCHFLIQNRRTLAQAAIQFLLQLPGVTVVLPRLYQCQQLAEILAAPYAPPLTVQELQRIASIGG